MRLLLNLIWLVFSGFWLAIGYAFFAALLCLTIVLIPFGLQLFKIAGFVLWPFGRELRKRSGSGDLNTVGNVLWAITGGLALFIGHLVTAAACAITIIGIPLAFGNLKIALNAFTPFGRDVVSSR